MLLGSGSKTNNKPLIHGNYFIIYYFIKLGIHKFGCTLFIIICNSSTKILEKWQFK